MGAITSQVLWAAFALAVAFGAIAQRTHFCTMGAVADIVNIGDWSRMRMWAAGHRRGHARLQRAWSALGWVEAGKSLYAGPRLIWLSNAGRRPDVRLRHGAGLGLRQQDAGAHRRRQPEVGGRVLRARPGGVRHPARASPAWPAWPPWTGWRSSSPAGPGPAVAGRRAHSASAKAQAALALGALARRRRSWPGRWCAAEGRSGDVLLGGLGIGAVIVGMWWVSGRLGYVTEDPKTLQEAFVGHQLAAHGVAVVRRADRLHDGLADLLQRQEQAADAGHRQHRRRDRRLGGCGAGHAQLSAGRALPAPKTPPTTWSVPR